MAKTKPMLEAEVAMLRQRVAELERVVDLRAHNRRSVIEDIRSPKLDDLPTEIRAQIREMYVSSHGEN